jgi:YVTN family beta-propeller protein
MKKLYYVIIPLLIIFIISSFTISFADRSLSKKERNRHSEKWEFIEGEALPTGMKITPTAASGSIFHSLNPGLPTRPDFLAGQAVSTATSPDKKTLLILTSGYNRNYDQSGRTILTESKEYVFIYDISENLPRMLQVLQIPNTFNGIAWNPRGHEFYISGGVDDNIHIFQLDGMVWREASVPVGLNHIKGLGLEIRPMTAGLAVNSSGTRLLVANYENDSVSLINLVNRTVITELDLRPGKINPIQSGVPGGEYPFWVVFKGDEKAYVSSQRDREIVALAVDDNMLAVVKRIKVNGLPNKMILNSAQTLLYVANDNTDTVAVIDTFTDEIIEEIETTAPKSVYSNPKGFKGSNPNSLALSPDEGLLFVTNGGTNSLSVIQLSQPQQTHKKEQFHGSRVIGLIPTGWYPNSVSLNEDGTVLYVINGKGNTGPNPDACRDTTSISLGSLNACRGANQYVLQLSKAGFLSLPMPSPSELAKLTWQVAYNNNFPSIADFKRNKETLDTLRNRIKHVIYIIKENRTYDQVLGDLEKGNGDPTLTILPEPITPNHHQLARQFVVFDNFYDSAGVSGDGWNWSTAARTTDFTEKTVPVNYAGRGLSYDWEGTNRNINTGYETIDERRTANPYTPDDPDLLPGTSDVAAPDSAEGEAGAGYLWDAALRAKLTVRNYGFFIDLTRYFLPLTDPAYIPISRNPFADKIIQSYPTKNALQYITDLYFRGYDMKNADFYLFKEWEREFDLYAMNNNLPNLQLVRFPHDHFGSFSIAIDGVNTVETQMADNDYAVGLLVEKVAKSKYKDDTLIFIIEDDAQNGPDHIDAHRSIAYIIGAYVKQDAVVSKHYTTVNMLRTIEDILGIESLGLNDGLAEPMAEVFDLKQKQQWTYTAIIPEVLRTTQLPLPERTSKNSLPLTAQVTTYTKPKHDANYWEEKMVSLDFTKEDSLDEPLFNRVLWTGMMGENVTYPTIRHGRDLSSNRQHLLQEFKNSKGWDAIPE